jgi:hypothetical protein
VRSLPEHTVVTICCTFNGGGLDLVAEAVAQCLDAGSRVLSPLDPTPAEIINDFWYIASDRYRDPILVERRHLQAVATSDLIWLIAPDGYVGFSAGIEIAFAVGRGVPVYTADHVAEPTIAAFAHTVSDVGEAVRHTRRSRRQPAATGSHSMLLDPEATGHDAASALDTLQSILLHPTCTQTQTAALATKVRAAVSGL